jgi:hypothetical protein
MVSSPFASTPQGPTVVPSRLGGWRSGGYYEREVRLTNAEMLALTTPVTVIPAPGVGFVTELLEAHIVSDSSGTAWTAGGGDDIAVRYASSTTIMTVETTGLITTGDVQIRMQRVAATVLTPIANAAIELFNVGSNFGGGNAANAFCMTLVYVVRSAVAFGAPV